MKKLVVFVLTLFLLGCEKSWKEIGDYYAYYGVNIDESVEILDNNEDVLIEGKILNITPDGIKIMGDVEPWKAKAYTIPHSEIGGMKVEGKWVYRYEVKDKYWYKNQDQIYFERPGAFQFGSGSWDSANNFF